MRAFIRDCLLLEGDLRRELGKTVVAPVWQDPGSGPYIIDRTYFLFAGHLSGLSYPEVSRPEPLPVIVGLLG